jgi:hypothetical protein
MSLLDILNFHSDTTKKIHLNIIRLKNIREEIENCNSILKNTQTILDILDEQILELFTVLSKIEMEEDIPFNLHISESHIILETIQYTHKYDNCKNAAIDVFKTLKNEIPDLSQHQEVTKETSTEYETINREQLLEIVETYKDIKDDLKMKSLFIQVFFEEIHLMFYISQYQI